MYHGNAVVTVMYSHSCDSEFKALSKASHIENYALNNIHLISKDSSIKLVLYLYE